MTGLAGVFLLFGLLMLSVRERIQRIQRMDSGKRSNGQEIPAQGSPLADSITQTIGLAGGVYIAMITTINFLKLDVPETFNFWGVSLDPVAMTAFVITVLQPFAMAVRDKFMR